MRRLGFLADLLSRPVLVGYMTGVAVIMIVSQLDKRHRGRPSRASEFVEQMRSFVTGGCPGVHWPTVALAAAVLALLLALARAAAAGAGTADRDLAGDRRRRGLLAEPHGIAVSARSPADPAPGCPASRLADLSRHW